MKSTSETDTLETLRATAESLDTRVRELARARPIVSVVGMFLVGFLTARLLSARRA
jgi:hypothetical protein